MKDIETFDSFCEAWGQPIADFEEDADQFVLGDLVESFTAGMRTEAISNMEREGK